MIHPGDTVCERNPEYLYFYNFSFGEYSEQEIGRMYLIKASMMLILLNVPERLGFQLRDFDKMRLIIGNFV